MANIAAHGTTQEIYFDGQAVGLPGQKNLAQIQTDSAPKNGQWPV